MSSSLPSRPVPAHVADYDDDRQQENSEILRSAKQTPSANTAVPVVSKSVGSRAGDSGYSSQTQVTGSSAASGKARQDLLSISHATVRRGSMSTPGYTAANKADARIDRKELRRTAADRELPSKQQAPRRTARPAEVDASTCSIADCNCGRPRLSSSGPSQPKQKIHATHSRADRATDIPTSTSTDQASHVRQGNDYFSSHAMPLPARPHSQYGTTDAQWAQYQYAAAQSAAAASLYTQPSPLQYTHTTAYPTYQSAPDQYTYMRNSISAAYPSTGPYPGAHLAGLPMARPGVRHAMTDTSVLRRPTIYGGTSIRAHLDPSETYVYSDSDTERSRSRRRDIRSEYPGRHISQRPRSPDRRSSRLLAPLPSSHRRAPSISRRSSYHHGHTAEAPPSTYLDDQYPRRSIQPEHGSSNGKKYSSRDERRLDEESAAAQAEAYQAQVRGSAAPPELITEPVARARAQSSSTRRPSIAHRNSHNTASEHSAFRSNHSSHRRSLVGTSTAIVRDEDGAIRIPMERGRKIAIAEGAAESISVYGSDDENGAELVIRTSKGQASERDVRSSGASRRSKHSRAGSQAPSRRESIPPSEHRRRR